MSQLIARHNTTKLYELTNINEYLTSILDTNIYTHTQRMLLEAEREQCNLSKVCISLN